jgi:hypothetical protein
MKTLTLSVHPLTLAAVIALAVPTVAIAAGTMLKPPVTVTGTSVGALLTSTNSGTGGAIKATSAKGKAITASGLSSGVYAATTNPSISNHTHGFGISGYDASTDGGTLNAGVFGNSVFGTGVSGTSAAGIAVAAYADNGDAVDATSTGGNGVLVHASKFGVYSTAGDTGVTGVGPTGVDAYSSSSKTAFGDGLRATGGRGGTGVHAIGGSSGCSQFCAAILAQPGGIGADLIEVTDVENNLIMHLDYSGNLTIAGLVKTGGSCSTGCITTGTTGGTNVVAYAARQASPTIEDVGDGQLVNGVGYVSLDPAYARTIDQRVPYHIFLTPDADSNGLYVTHKTLAGFAVRENRGGRSTLTFEYRVVAKPVDSDDTRLPVWRARPFGHAARPVPTTALVPVKQAAGGG